MSGLEFRLTEEHLKLLRRANVSWIGGVEGAPAINGQAPYGDGTKPIAVHMAEILDWQVPDADDERAGNALRDTAWEVHRETLTALEIVLQYAGLDVQPGLYRREREDDPHSWVLVGD